MIWLFLALTAAFVWSLANILDKHVITDEMRDPLVAATVAGFTIFLFLSLFSFLANPFTLPFPVAMAAFLTGVTYNLAILFLYSAEKGGEISRVIPLVKLDPLLVLLLSFIFLGELLSPSRYAGVILLTAGAVLISLKKRPRHPWKGLLSLWRDGKRRLAHSAIGLALAASGFYAVRNILLDVSAAQAGLEQVLAWVGIGGLLVGAVILARHHPHLLRRSKRGMEHLVLSDALTIVGFLLFSRAIALGSPTLVAGVGSTNIFFTFLIATALSKTHTHIIKEEMRGSTLLVKAAAIMMVMAGLVALL